MAITFRAASTASGTTSITITKPTGTVDGDLMIVVITSDTDGYTASAPAGWTLMDTANHTLDLHQSDVWYKVASSEGASWNWTSVSSPVVGCCLSFYDSVGGGAWALSAHNSKADSGGVNATNTSITSQDNSLLFIAYTNDSLWTVTTPPSGMTSAGQIDGAAHCLNPYYQLIATGASESKTLTYSGDDAWIALASVFTYSAQTLATITSPIVDGATSDSGTYSGFTGTPDTLTIETTGALYSTAMTSLSAAAGSFTFNVPGLPTVNTARTPYTTASWAIRAKLSVSAESATKTVTHNPPSGYSALEITGTWSLVSETSFAYGWDAAPGLTSQLVYPTANNLTVNASTGAFTTDQTTGTIQYYLWDVANANLKPFTWTLGGTLFRTSSLTTSTLTASALTASTLIA